MQLVQKREAITTKRKMNRSTDLWS